MKVIVNADDLGYSEQVNDSIFELMRKGRVTSATVLANGPGADHAARWLKELPQCSFGAHLNLSEFRPLSRHHDLQPILDEAGAFRGNAARETCFTASLREGIFQEFCAQIERLKELGISISHLDSHHHMHTTPGIFRVLKAVQKRFGIRKVRLTLNLYPLPRSVPASRRLLKSLWNVAMRHCYRTVTTDAFTSLKTFVERGSTIPRSYRSVELMVHPGWPSYEPETRLLHTDWWRELPFEVSFISYAEL